MLNKISAMSPRTKYITADTLAPKLPEVTILLNKWLWLVGCSSTSSNQSCRIRPAMGINGDLQPRDWQLEYRYGGKFAISSYCVVTSSRLIC